MALYLINISLIIIAFIAMELIAWLLHKYVMHKFLWYFHSDHHIPHAKKYERNDFFGLIFGIPSWLLIMFGIMGGNDFRLYLGIGITLYGVCYILIHDGLIHQRIKIFTNTNNRWLLALKKGHLAHHIHDSDPNYKKEDDICFGMLWVPRKFFKN